MFPRIPTPRFFLLLIGLVLAGGGCAHWYDEGDYGAKPASRSAAQGAAGSFVPVPPPGARQIPIPANGLHTVVRGNTVYSISRLYGVPVRSIIETNGLRPPYLLKVGDRLRLTAPRTYRVAKGDTVYSISRQYDVPMSELMRVNGIRPPHTIKVGQTLSIPAGDARSAAAVETPPPAKPSSTTRPASRQATPSQVAALPSPPPRSGRLFLWPVNGKLVARFGGQPGGRHNDGINIAA